VGSAPAGLKSEGQRLLLAVDVASSEIARLVPSSKQLVGQWRAGRCNPRQGVRERLLELYGIPCAAWDRDPGAAAEPPSPVVEPPRTPSDPPAAEGDTMGAVDQSIASIRRLMDDPDATAAVKRQMLNALTSALRLRAQIEAQASIREDGLVRHHPEWANLRDAILRALRDEPSAMQKVRAALVEMQAAP
jgi:hypothetical protein